MLKNYPTYLKQLLQLFTNHTAQQTAKYCLHYFYCALIYNVHPNTDYQPFIIIVCWALES